VGSLYREFPIAPPGLGLLLLRLVLASSLVFEAAGLVTAGGAFGASALPSSWGVGAALLAVLLSLGLLTPVATSLAALIEVVRFVGASSLLAQPNGAWQLPLFRIAVAGALVCLGPGAYSIDRRLFGPVEIVILPRTPARRRRLWVPALLNTGFRKFFWRRHED
jgi:uncharacterized membrane protein YphA (DoxX/SURF4 family)